MTWQADVLAHLTTRMLGAPSPADRGVLLREAARINNGPFQVPPGVALEDIDAERFGLVAETSGGDRFVNRRPQLPPALPEDLRRQLDAVLPVDTQLRRPDRHMSADGVLHRLGFNGYRNPTQKAAVRALLTMPPASTLLATLATGTGKSLLFQLAARWLRDNAPEGTRPTVLVVVPTVALALDHQASTSALPGLADAKALTSAQPRSERDNVIQAFRRGEVPVLFASPEMALGRLREPALELCLPMDSEKRASAVRGRLAQLFVDEAHIVATWGRSFRPELQRIPELVGELRQRAPELSTVLLSATVDEPSLELLKQQYEGSLPDRWLHINEGVPRREFDLVHQWFSSDAERDAVLLRLADFMPRPAIFYTTEVAHAENLLEELRRRGYERSAVFTGRTRAERRGIVDAWRRRELDLVVATSAFGMGVDQADVRVVVHACVPESGARYYQEIGRAGRDGHQAFGVILATPADVGQGGRQALGNTLSYEIALPRWLALLDSRRPQTGQDGCVRYDMDLTAEGEHLERGYPAGSYNLRWNKSLLVQLQRYGALTVVAGDEVEDDEHLERWTVKAAPEHPDLWQRDTAAKALEAILQQRDDEEAEAQQAFKEFNDVREGRSGCWIQALWHLLDGHNRSVPPCGRCPVCRLGNLQPPTYVEYGGLDVAWPICEPTIGVPVALRVERHEHDNVRSWIGYLADEGVRQFIVPDELAQELAQSGSRLRIPCWCLTWGELLPSGKALSPLVTPTAVVMPSARGDAVERAWRWAKRWHERSGQVCWWVALPETIVDGRLLEDIVSSRPPRQLPKRRTK